MAEAITLAAERRSETGKGAARQLRQRGRIPAVVYGHGREPQSLSIVAHDIEHALAGHTSGSRIFDLTVDGKATPTLIREVQRHPVQSKILHVDFLEIHAGEKLSLDVPVVLVGSAEGVKNGGGVLDQVMRDVHIEVLPKDIPERLEVDVSALDIGDSLHVRDIHVPNAKVLTDPGKTICTVVRPRVELEVHAEVPEEEGEETEPELIRKAKEEESAEGDAERAEE